METTPNSLRIQIALTGRTNSGKSSLLNLIAGQSSAITSPLPGTTTDVVAKAMELRPLGAVLLLDTAGTDDTTELGSLRTERTSKAIDRADVLVVVTTPGVWGSPEKTLLGRAAERKIPALVVVNKIDLDAAGRDFAAELSATLAIPVLTSCAADCSSGSRENFLNRFTDALLKLLPESAFQNQPLLRDLIHAGSVVLLVTPIDIQAPRGRLILPQIQAIRDVLDGDCICVVAKENALPEVYDRLAAPPALVVCDSQVVDLMIRSTSPAIPCTTFSILMARLKGDLEQFVNGVKALENLQDGDRILIAESCTHHASDDDIGRVKIPRMIRQKTGKALEFQLFSGTDFPADLDGYKLVLHCGGCMLNRRSMLNRLHFLKQQNIPVVNYGMCISYCKGVLERVLSPFKQN